ncbi:MAG: TRIC cation channel family protein, partial [Atopobium sp.]|nr:TRIC cation channel family protein [Atopobium sp.]
MPPFFSPYGTDAISVSIPYWLDLLTVIIGAISGILVARDRHLDLVGFV